MVFEETEDLIVDMGVRCVITFGLVVLGIQS
jgi:hypothetical protein